MTDLIAGRIALLAAALAAMLTGCAPTVKPEPAAPTRKIKKLPPPIDQVDRIALLAPHNAVVNLDSRPGPDGIVAQVMLVKDFGQGPKTVLVSGKVDLMVFEGSIPKNLSEAPKPFFSRTFTAEELAQRVVGQYGVLLSYALQAEWASAPQSKSIWILARYRPQSGEALFSSPAEQRMPSAGSEAN